MIIPGKITIVGAGHVGSHCAMALAFAGAASEIALVDKDSEKARSQASDVADALSFPASVCRVRGGSLPDCADSEIVVISVGEARRPGQTRLDMLGNSVVMLHDLLEDLRPLALEGIVVTITNPADIVADFVRRGLGLPRNRVFGTGTILDTARLVRLLSEQTQVAKHDVRAFVLGEHGDSSMIPFSQVTIGGRQFRSFPSLNPQALVAQTRRTGMAIVEGKGSTEFGIGQALAVLCGAILRDEKRVLPLSVFLQGEYGQRDLHCGVPCLVGKSGIEAVIPLSLTEEEQSQFDASCQVILSHIQKAQSFIPTRGVLNA